MLADALPIGVACRPPKCWPAPVVTMEPLSVAPVPLILPTTPSVLPTVADPLTVNADTVVLPLEPTVVNRAVLGVTLPIGVF